MASLDPLYILKQVWGYDSFRSPQDEIIQASIEGKNVLALLPTGAGKSLCFQVPALATEGMAIVVSPLIALMRDQVENLRKRGINAKAIHSGMSHREIDDALDNCRFGKVKFLYVSPERLKSPLFLERIVGCSINLLVIDEAHCISQWGYDFRPSYLEIATIRTLFPHVPVMAVTASATPEVIEDIITRLEIKEAAVYRKSFIRENLSYSSIYTERKEEKIFEILNNVSGSSVIYVGTRKQASILSYLLHQRGVNTDYFHAALPTKEKERKQAAWTSGKVRVMVATNAFGMGIDKADVRTVIHYEIPLTLENYYQEAGRAGRDGKLAYAILLYNENDKKTLFDKVAIKYPDKEEIKRVYKALGNYYNLAVGSMGSESYDFDISAFCDRYQLSKLATYHALKRLETLQYIAFNESYYAPSKLKVIVDQLELYKFQVAKEALDGFIKLILRVYGGELFTHLTTISEEKIAHAGGLNVGDVKRMLEALHQHQIVSYIQQKDTPQINFEQPRVLPESLKLEQVQFDVLKKRDEEAVQKILSYIELTTKDCRSVSLANYFGDHNAENCKICDLCIARKKEGVKLKPLLISFIRENEAVDITAITNQFKSHDRILVIETLRLLVDEGQLKINEDGRYSL